MKRFVIMVITVIIVGVGIYVYQDYQSLLDVRKYEKSIQESIPKLQSEQKDKELLPLMEGDLLNLIGSTGEEVKEKFGDPDRKDESAYGYTWWVYTDGTSKYVQFGVEDEKVVTVFATGDDISMDSISIGDDYEQLEDLFTFKDNVTYQNGLSYYKFMLEEEGLKEYPLVKISNDIFLMMYFDTFEKKLSSIRLMTGDTLLKQRIYETEYRGSLPDDPSFSDKEWEKIEESMEQQIFDITNVYRDRFDLPALIKDKNVQHVAYKHSKDMEENNYFSHYAKDGSGLKERLQEEDIYYMSAGENIAAQHTDAPAAMEGWLNSEGHREALLNDEYNHLGVGVYRFYYTQNFLFKP